jgi:putative transposase
MSQSLSQIWIHIVFSTKDRQPLLQKNITQRLYHYIKSISHNHGCEITAIGGIEDHIHILTTLNKNISLTTLIREIKKSSSIWMKEQRIIDSSLKEFNWQNGYGVFSVSKSNIDHVKAYIQNQHDYHKKIDFKNELIKFLERHNIPYHNDYLWS